MQFRGMRRINRGRGAEKDVQCEEPARARLGCVSTDPAQTGTASVRHRVGRGRADHRADGQRWVEGVSAILSRDSEFTL